MIIPAKEYEGYHGHYIKYSMRNAMDIATISCSVVSKVDQQAGVIENVRITFGVAAPVPYRCTKAEEALKGMKIEESLYEKTAQLIRGGNQSERFLESIQGISSSDRRRNCGTGIETYRRTCRR